MFIFRDFFNCKDSTFPSKAYKLSLNFSVKSTTTYLICLCKTSIDSVMNSFVRVDFYFSFMITLSSPYVT